MYEIRYAEGVADDLTGLRAYERRGNPMKVVRLDQAVLDSCIEDAQHERVVITRDGRPVALIVGVEGMDEEQLERAGSDTFWKLMTERRAQQTLSRAELERRIDTSKAS